jgi:hypothetical protein
MTHPQQGSALVVGLILLSLIALLGLAGAATAQVELQLARNEQFRENATAAASAGIEFAISQVTASDNMPTHFIASLPGTRDRFEIDTRLLGYEPGLPQMPGGNLAGAHFEILSTGHAARGAVDRQRAIVMLTVEQATPAAGADCEPVAPGVRCATLGELQRLSWQRLPAD